MVMVANVFTHQQWKSAQRKEDRSTCKTRFKRKTQTEWQTHEAVDKSVQKTHLKSENDGVNIAFKLVYCI